MDREARNAFALRFERMARGEAVKFAQQCLRLDADDLFQMGMLYQLEQAEKLASYEHIPSVVLVALRRRFIKAMLKEDSPIRVPGGNEAKPHTVLNMGFAFDPDDEERNLYALMPVPVDQDVLDIECLHLALAALPV